MKWKIKLLKDEISDRLNQKDLSKYDERWFGVMRTLKANVKELEQRLEK